MMFSFQALANLMDPARRVGCRLVALCALTGLLAQPLAAQEGQGTYLVGPGDVLTVTVFGEEGLTGQFTVSPDGAISYPVLGQIEVAGLAPVSISQRLEEDLAEHFPGLSVATVVSQYAPVFVFGDVQTPGRHEYRPGMIALELMVLGGGMRRPDVGMESSQLQMIAARQEYGDLELQILSMEVKRRRLEAEYAGRAFEAPAPDHPDPLIRDIQKSINEGETTLHATRLATLASEEKALAAQEDTYQNEITNIEQSISLHEDEISLINEDVAATKQLVDRGLTSRSNLRESERRLSATRRDALELGSYLARAQQNLLALRQRRTSLQETRQNEAASEIQALDVELVRSRSRQQSVMETMRELALVSGARVNTPTPARLTLSILRTVDGEHREMPASETDPIRPGDILRAQMEVGPETLAATIN